MRYTNVDYLPLNRPPCGLPGVQNASLPLGLPPGLPPSLPLWGSSPCDRRLAFGWCLVP